MGQLNNTGGISEPDMTLDHKAGRQAVAAPPKPSKSMSTAQKKAQDQRILQNQEDESTNKGTAGISNEINATKKRLGQ